MFQYLREVRAELRHVSWPTRQQSILYTIIVVAVSLATAAYLGILDYIFSTFIRQII